MQNYSYRVETYAIFINTDKSVLKINPIIEKYGFQFVLFDLPQLEKSFFNLFMPLDSQKSGSTVSFEGSDMVVTEEFYNAVRSFSPYHTMLFMERELIMLKKIEDYEQQVINNSVELSNGLKALGETQKFVNNIIQEFRLFKVGEVDYSMIFQIADNNRKVLGNISGRSFRYSLSKYSISYDEVDNFKTYFTNNFKPNQLTELAIENYNLSYYAPDISTKFLTLMTCLESIFNIGGHEITHTISRHCALVVSKTRDEFINHYDRIKRLYGHRSAIIHGGRIDKNTTFTDELQDYVRRAINYCVKLDIDRKTFFNNLNSMGFHE